MRFALCDLVFDRAVSDPERPAVTYRDDTVGYAELAERIRAFAGSLSRLGVQPGDRVAVFLEKRIEAVVAIFGTAAAGAAFVPINPVLKPRQVGHILRDSGSSVLVTSRDRYRALSSELQESASVKHVVVVDAVEGDAVGEESGCTAWDSMLEPGADGHLIPTIDADLAAVLYTSGSTGSPKGVALTHRNLIAGAESVNAYLGNTEQDVILAVLPLSFDAGLSQLTTGFAAGAHVILMNYLLPRDVVRLCERHGVTAITCVPPLWIQLASLDWTSAGSSIRYFANTGGRMPRVTLDALRAVFPNASPFLMYGLTEAFRSTYLPPDEIDRRPDSIGKAIPNAEILVVRPDGSRCDSGEPGELVHRGALVALGYWQDPARTAERFRPLPDGYQGWAATPEAAVWSGDLVRTDDEGFLYFVGRADDMIKTSGYRVSPSEVEEAAVSTLLVRDAVAIGLADDALGQIIALVVAGDGPVDEAALRSALRKDLPTFMVPQLIVALDVMPRSANGKYDRFAIRQHLEGMTGS